MEYSLCSFVPFLTLPIQLNWNLCLSSILQKYSSVLDRTIKASVIEQHGCSCCLQLPTLRINMPKFYILVLGVNCHDWITHWLQPIKIIYMHILNYLLRFSYCSHEKYSFLFCYLSWIQIPDFLEQKLLFKDCVCVHVLMCVCKYMHSYGHVCGDQRWLWILFLSSCLPCLFETGSLTSLDLMKYTTLAISESKKSFLSPPPQRWGNNYVSTTTPDFVAWIWGLKCSL